MSINKINESELFSKYKSSYKSAFLDFSLHTFLLSCSFYSLWFFRSSWLSCLTIPLLGLLNIKTFIIFHDCCHQSYTPNKPLNYVLSHLTGTFVFTSPLWELDHTIHHINATIPGYNLQAYHEEVISKSNLFDNIVKLSISDCYHNLKLRLYSEKNNKYIRLDEVENKYTSCIFYYINLFLYISLQCPVLLCKLINPFCSVNKLYNNSLLLLDNLFLQINWLNNYPNHNNHILLVNHSSSCDGYLSPKIPHKNVSIVKNSLFYIPFLGQVFWLLNFIFIKRDDKKSRNNTKTKIIQKLKENNIVQIFPQGTREKNKFFKNNEIVLKKGSIEIALETNVPIVLCYHNIGDRIDDENKIIHFDKKVYAIISNPILLPNEYNELPLEEKVNILYKIIYDEFIRLEQIVLDKKM